MEFSKRFKEWIKENKIKQIDLANKLGVNKSYISNVAAGRVAPNKQLVDLLVDMSGKSCNWWLHGVDEYDNLHSLNMVVNALIESGQIRSDGSYDDDIKEMLVMLLNKEIQVKLDKK